MAKVKNHADQGEMVDVVTETPLEPVPSDIETPASTEPAAEQKPQPPVQPSPRKVPWRQRADRLFLRRMGKAVPMDPARLAQEAERRADFLIAAIEGNAHGRSNYPKQTIDDYEFELNALRNGVWRPGLRRQTRKQPEGYNFNVLAVPGADPQENALDRLLTDSGD